MSFITSMIVDIFNAIGTALAGAFLAELSLVQDFINNTHVVFGGNFNTLLGFNAVVIPGLALLVALVWLAAKGLAGGNSKTSTEDIVKRVLGALVISFVLSLVVNPVQDLIGALDSSLMSLANVNSQGLQHAFAGIAVTSAIGGIEDSIFISIVILFIGIIIAGALILILILAHAAVFLLVYFAPYLTLFRKDGFREAVEGVVAALSLPFIITSILAIGIATMGATASAPTTVGAITTLSAMVGSHFVSLPTLLTGSTTSISAIDYFTNAFGGILILASAVFLPKFILGMVFQAGSAMHDAFRSGHQQLASTAMNHASPSAAGKGGKLSRLLNYKRGNQGGDNATSSGSTGAESNNRKSLVDQAYNSTKDSGSSTHTVPTSQPQTDSNPQTDRTDVPSSAGSSSSAPPKAEPSASPIDSATPKAEPSASPIDSAPQGQDAEGPAVDASTGIPGTVPPPVLSGDSTSDETTTGKAPPPKDNKKAANSKPLTKKFAHFTADHYKGTARAIPQALSAMPHISPESPIHTTIEARSAWREAKRQSIRQVREERATDERENPRDWRKKDPANEGPKPPEIKEPAESNETAQPDVENTRLSSQGPPDKKDS